MTMVSAVALLVASAVSPTLLPLPALPANSVRNVTATDVNPLGVVVARADTLTVSADGSSRAAGAVYRWADVPRAGWVRQALAEPAGTTSADVAGIDDLAEAGGTLRIGGVQRAVRWAVDGRSYTLIGGAGSRVDAVGPRGPWGTATDDAADPIAGTAALVARNGTRTELAGTGDLDAGFRKQVGSIGGPGTALVHVRDGIGQGQTVTPVVYRDGKTVRLNVIGRVFGPPACASDILPDGTVAYSGYRNSPAGIEQVLALHRGGVPGTEVILERNTQDTADQPAGTLGCDTVGANDLLGGDGGLAATYLADGLTRAAYWAGDGTRTVIPLAAGETAARSAAVATGGRVVVQTETAAGARLFYWHAGTRTDLLLPGGYTLKNVVELTDRGLVLADVADAIGQVRPVTWRVPAT